MRSSWAQMSINSNFGIVMLHCASWTRAHPGRTNSELVLKLWIWRYGCRLAGLQVPGSTDHDIKVIAYRPVQSLDWCLVARYAFTSATGAYMSSSENFLLAENAILQNIVMYWLLRSPVCEQVWNSRIERSPAIIAYASNATHVQQAVKCSRQDGIQVSPRSGGHSYEGA